MSKFITIDPGVEFGWAIFSDAQLRPEIFGIYTPIRGLEWLDRCRLSLRMIHDLLAGDSPIGRPEFLLCEWPAYRESAAGRAAAASDSLVKLSVMVGLIVGACGQIGIDFEPVTVPTWLGQMQPNMLARRVQRITGYTDKEMPKSHALDAVGLGMWRKGLL